MSPAKAALLWAAGLQLLGSGCAEPPPGSDCTPNHRVVLLDSLTAGGNLDVRDVATSLDGPGDIVAADVDGDGVPDAVAVDGSSLISILGIGSARPSLVRTPSLFADEFEPRIFAQGDLDVDGDDDLVVFAGPTTVMESNGDGTFAVADMLLPSPGNYVNAAVWAATVADVTGDGVLDVTLTGGDAVGVQIFAGDGGLSFGGPEIAPSAPPNYVNFEIASSDLDGSGTADLVAAGDWSQGSDEASVLTVHLRADGAGLGPATRYEIEGTEDVGGASWAYAHVLSFFDVDADSRLDAVLFDSGHARSLVSWLHADGAGGYEPRATLWELPEPGAGYARVADVDGDGALDIVLTSEGGVVVWRRSLEGGFHSRSAATLSSLAGATLGDMTGDGLLDIIATVADTSCDYVD